MIPFTKQALERIKMGAELQSLLDKIQTEGIAKAEAEANRILEDARQKAETLQTEAQERSDALRAEAEADARRFQQRAEQSVRQAARDVLLGVRSSIEHTLQRILLAKVSERLTPDFLGGLIAEVIRSYAQSQDAATGMQLELKPEQVEALTGVVLEGLQEAARKNLELHADRSVTAGFRVLLADGRIEHDFSANAIQGAMTRLLRPELAKLLADD